MPELPQFNETQSVLQQQKVNSKAEGFDAWAKTLGNIANEAGNQAEKIEEEKSNALFMVSANSANELKTKTHIEMIQNPDKANNIAKNALSVNESIKQAAVLNEKDRSRLNYMVNENQSQINLRAAETDHSFQVRSLGNKFWDEYPISMRQIEEAIGQGDFDKAKILEENLHANALSAAKIGSLSPEAFGRVNKSMRDLYDRASYLTKLSQDPNGVSAHEYHANKISPFASQSFDNIGQPVHGNTQWMANHLNYDRTMQGQLNALYNGQPVNFGVVASASENDYNKFIMTMNGVNQVKGAISSGIPFNQIQAHIETLETKEKLSAIEEGQVTYWKSLNNRMSSDNAFYGIMGQVGLGQEYTAEHQAQSASLRATKGGADLVRALQDNDNKYIGQMVDLARSLSLDPHYIKPIPVEWSNEVKSSFQKDAPVLPALRRLEYVAPEFRAYLAEAMPKSHQGMSVWVAGLTLGKTDSSFQADLIHANQNQIEPNAPKGEGKEKNSLITSGKEDVGTKADNIWSAIISQNDNMKSIYTYLGKLPNGASAQSGFRQMAINYVNDQAQRAGDVDLSHKDDYINTFANNINKGFNFYQSDKALINLTDLPITRQQDVDYLTNYALSEAYKRIHEGKSESDFQTSLSINPLMVVSTPDRRLIVIDRYGRAAVTNDGHEAFDVPYTTNLLAAAQKRSNDINDYLSGYGVKHEYMPTGFNLNAQGIMLHAAAERERATQQKHNEQALLKAKSEQSKGLIEKGNIDVEKLPNVQNEDGTYSTVKTITIEEDGKTILLPTIINGKAVSNKEAITYYHKTGKHLGIFSSEKEAESYDKKLHKEQGWTK